MTADDPHGDVPCTDPCVSDRNTLAVGEILVMAAVCGLIAWLVSP